MLRTLTHADGTTRQIHLGGWKRQARDLRDGNYSLKVHGSLLKIPALVDNRPLCSPIDDQGQLGSCTANMFAGIVEYNENKRLAGQSQSLHSVNLPGITISNVTVSPSGLIYTTTIVPKLGAVVSPTPPGPGPAAPTTLEECSRLFEYYVTRTIEGTVSEDSGATIRDAIKAGALYGVANESLWPYDVSQFAVQPPEAAYANAATHKVTSYHSIADGDIQTMKSALASGFLVGFGFQVYDYMMSAKMAQTGILGPPNLKDQSLLGGHAVDLVGYDDSKGAFIVRNSWGTSWGPFGGYFYMDYDYVANTSLASDFWVVQSAPI